jgi:hypothetical protein
MLLAFRSRRKKVETLVITRLRMDSGQKNRNKAEVFKAVYDDGTFFSTRSIKLTGKLKH